MQIQRVALKPSHTNPGELSEDAFYECNFCNKLVGTSAEARRLCETLSGDEAFYCSFCLRHGFNTRNNKHVLPISFRSIIGYYYYAFYCTEEGMKRRMWLSEIKDYIKCHEQVGLLNPLFSYDPETYMWFVDFAKVGNGRRKVEVNDVLRTVTNVLACFNLYHFVQGDLNRFYGKYRDAIDRFYQQRFRPEGRPCVVPTLSGIRPSVKFDLEITRNFLPHKLIAR